MGEEKTKQNAKLQIKPQTKCGVDAGQVNLSQPANFSPDETGGYRCDGSFEKRRMQQSGFAPPLDRESPSRNSSPMDVMVTTRKSLEGYRGFAIAAGRILADDWSENGKGSGIMAPRL
ncbi:MAG TPA: hypothetical protein VGN61_02475 [Verrucomicrobiae bacterium]|jgi:hypothetical protein